MTYSDIIEWIEDEYDFEPDEDPEKAFNTISNDWEDVPNRDTLENTLGSEGKDFIIKRIKALIPQTVKPKKESEFVLNDTLQGIVNFFKRLFR